MRATLLALFALLSPLAAIADTMTWRVATVTSTQQAGETVRRGVAIFSNGEPATLTLRLRPTASPSQGKMPFSTNTIYRFEDGSTFTVVGRGFASMSPEGAPLASENHIEGNFTGGTGKFSGITGTVVIKSRSGLDPSVPGILGDQFSSAEANYTISK